MSDTHVHAGWHLAGAHLPEVPYVRLPDMEAARDYIRDALIEQQPDGNAEEEFAYDGGRRAKEWARAIEALRTPLSSRGIALTYDMYVYEVEPCNDVRCSFGTEEDADDDD